MTMSPRSQVEGVSQVPHESQISVKECRRLLGASAAGKTDAQVTSDREQMESLAHAMFEVFTSEMKRDPDALRWLLYADETGGTE
jgi:hypothetical protein